MQTTETPKAGERTHTITFTLRNGRKLTERRTFAAHQARSAYLGKMEARRQECAPTSFDAVDFAYQAEAAAILAIL